MQIALLCEGTYPNMPGGVSVWCEQLVSGLPEHQFHVYSLSAQRLSALAPTLPANVHSVIDVPLWDAPPAGRRAVHQRRADEAYDQLLYAMLGGPNKNEQFIFSTALQRLFEYAQLGNLTRALTSRRNAVRLFEFWSKSGQSPSLGGRQGLLLLKPTLADALQANVWLEHFLRPLSCRPAEVELCHAASNGLSPLLAFTSKWAYQTPFVLTEHGIYLRERYLDLHNSSLSAAFKSFLLRFYSLMTRCAYQLADLITPGSHYNERWELQQGADPDRIRPVYNGINPAFFPLPTAEPAEPTISWVGRIDPLKDLETLIRAFGSVRDSMPQAKLRMFGVAPAGNEGYAKHCQQLVGQLGLTGAATFEGRVEAVIDGYHAGHMVALTSISEGFPYTLIEAMASGRATVATDVGGVTEALGETGLVVPARDTPAVARACLSLLGDAELRQRLSQAARERVLSQFTLESFLHVYRHIYPHVVAKQLCAGWQP